jgi:hypothetical protein
VGVSEENKRFSAAPEEEVLNNSVKRTSQAVNCVGNSWQFSVKINPHIVAKIVNRIVLNFYFFNDFVKNCWINTASFQGRYGVSP